MTDDEKPCANKLVFDSKSEAEKQARALKWQRHVNLRAYKCRHCGLWHLSSNPAD